MKVKVPILVQDVEATAAEGIRATDDDTIEDAFFLGRVVNSQPPSRPA